MPTEGEPQPKDIIWERRNDCPDALRSNQASEIGMKGNFCCNNQRNPNDIQPKSPMCGGLCFWGTYRCLWCNRSTADYYTGLGFECNPCGADYLGPSRYEDLLRRAQQPQRLRTVAEDNEEMRPADGDDLAVDPFGAEPRPASSSTSSIAQQIRDVAARVNAAAAIQPAQSVASSTLST